jgi:hypothetical protein
MTDGGRGFERRRAENHGYLDPPIIPSIWSSGNLVKTGYLNPSIRPLLSVSGMGTATTRGAEAPDERMVIG